MPSGQGWQRALISVLFVLSGLTALVYEVLWLRGFAIVLGSTLYSMSCVLTAFMLGLAAGSLIAARVLRDPPRWLSGRYLLAYGLLELVVGLYGAAFTYSLFAGQDRYVAILSSVTSEGAATKLLVHFVFGVVLLIIPTLCMGCTLPVLSMTLPKGADTAALYGFNTVGAAVGSIVASFVFIWLWGCFVTTAIVAATNVLIFLACAALSSRIGRSEAGGAEDEEAAKGPLWSGTLVLALAFFSGYAFFAFELVWNRCLGLVLGNRIYVTSVTLGLVLGCLAAGARISRLALLGGRSPGAILQASYGIAAAATAGALVFAQPALRGGSGGATLGFVVFLVIVPATAMGIAFPLLIALPVAGSRGAHVGRVYAVNTLGSVLGTLATGYVVIGALDSAHVLLLNGLLMLGCVVLLGRARLPVVAFAVVAALLGATQWTACLARVDPAKTIVLQEDAHGIFSISPIGSGELSVKCNTTELVYHYGDPRTQFVQESQADLPLIYAPRSDRVVVLGSGYGITAGTFALHDSVKDVDAVEILPLMVTHAEYFAKGTHDYHRNPKVRIHVADGRHFLAMAREPYDVISINVSDPYLPGSASLFSLEFYELVSRRLAKGGIVCQHIFGPDSPSLVAAFRKHFPHVHAVPGYLNSVSIVGAEEPLEPRALARIEADPRVRASLAAAGVGPTYAALIAEGEAALARLAAMPVAFENSDVHPGLEFRRSAELDTFFSNR